MIFGTAPLLCPVTTLKVHLLRLVGVHIFIYFILSYLKPSPGTNACTRVTYIYGLKHNYRSPIHFAINWTKIIIFVLTVYSS